MGATNSGVERTATKGKKTDIADFAIILDWLSFTIFGHSLQVVLEDVLGFGRDDFFHAGAGSYGYREKYVLKENPYVTVFTDGREDQGIHVQISGQGCQFMLRRLQTELFTNVLEYDGQFTRVDLALDDREARWYTIPQLMGHIRRQEIVSCWKKAEVDTGLGLSRGELQKQVIYLGSPRSDFSLCIYNKTLEQKSSGRLTPQELEQLPQGWIRWEITCRHRRAQSLVEKLLERGMAGEVFAGLLRGAMRIVRRNELDSNRRRWPEREKWWQFVGQAEPLVLYVPPVEQALKRKVKWLQNQVAPTLAALCQMKNGTALVFEAIAMGQSFIKAPLARQVEVYNQQVKDDASVRNLVRRPYADYVLELLRNCAVETAV